MAKVDVRNAVMDDVVLIADHVREADALEAKAQGFGIEPGLARCLALSPKAWLFTINGEPAALMGVAPASVLSGVGVPWMIATDVVDRYPVTFLRNCRLLLPSVLGVYQHLVNFVDDRNTRSQRFLAALGFTLSKPVPFGPHGLPFRRFELRRAR